MASSTTFQKRQKERARLDKQRDKDAVKKQRREEKSTRTDSPGGGDPDIAGIIPGPQPMAESDGLDRLTPRDLVNAMESARAASLPTDAYAVAPPLAAPGPATPAGPQRPDRT